MRFIIAICDEDVYNRRPFINKRTKQRRLSATIFSILNSVSGCKLWSIGDNYNFKNVFITYWSTFIGWKSVFECTLSGVFIVQSNKSQPFSIAVTIPHQDLCAWNERIITLFMQHETIERERSQFNNDN